MIIGIDHIDLCVGDLQAGKIFYEKLGFRILRETEHVGRAVELVHPDMPMTVIELHSATEEWPLGLRHIGFAVDDIHDASAKVAAQGIEQEDQPFFYEMTGRWLGNFFDDDGRKVQLVGDDQVHARGTGPNVLTVEADVSPGRLKELGVAGWEMWSSDTGTYDYPYDKKEMFYCLKGNVRLTADNGQRAVVKPGSLVTIDKTANVQWEILTPVLKHYLFPED